MRGNTALNLTQARCTEDGSNSKLLFLQLEAKQNHASDLGKNQVQALDVKVTNRHTMVKPMLGAVRKPGTKHADKQQEDRLHQQDG